jgi:hypothetical protein
LPEIGVVVVLAVVVAAVGTIVAVVGATLLGTTRRFVSTTIPDRSLLKTTFLTS